MDEEIDGKLDLLEADAEERGLTPKAWWFGSTWHELLLERYEQDPAATVHQGRLVELRGLPVKRLEESPQRLALWCAEGVLDV